MPAPTVTPKTALNSCIHRTNVTNAPEPYRGKVRDVYPLSGDVLGIVVTDRISAFDYIMRQPIPFKGQILNQLSTFGFQKVQDLVDTHVIDTPHPNVTIARKAQPLPVEVVLRGFLAGHAWRVYNSGERSISGVPLPEGMVQNQAFETPILTPATKAQEGHDEDISEEEILRQNLVAPDVWEEIKTSAFRLFQRGQQIARQQGLYLVDTKYEFGLYQGRPILIDEVHTTDSSRFFYADGYEERLRKGEPQKQLSKEFLREWLMEQGFQGQEGQTLPDLSDELRMDIFHRYSELFELLTGKPFEPTVIKDINKELWDVFEPYLGG